MKTLFKTALAVTLTLLFAAPASAAPATGKSKPPSTLSNKGVMVEFRRLEEEIIKRRRGSVVREKTLTNNLLRALRAAIARRFYAQRKELLKTINAASLKGNYDNPTSPLVYYVRFKTKERLVLVRFDYLKDPEYFLQSPSYEKLLIKSLGKGEHSKEKPKAGKTTP